MPISKHECINMILCMVLLKDFYRNKNQSVTISLSSVVNIYFIYFILYGWLPRPRHDPSPKTNMWFELFLGYEILCILDLIHFLLFCNGCGYYIVIEIWTLLLTKHFTLSKNHRVKLSFLSYKQISTYFFEVMLIIENKYAFLTHILLFLIFIQ